MQVNDAGFVTPHSPFAEVWAGSITLDAHLGRNDCGFTGTSYSSPNAKIEYTRTVSLRLGPFSHDSQPSSRGISPVLIRVGGQEHLLPSAILARQASCFFLSIPSLPNLFFHSKVGWVEGRNRCPPSLPSESAQILNCGKRKSSGSPNRWAQMA